MNDKCYLVDSETSILVFGDISCTDGSINNFIDSHEATKYILVNGRFVPASTSMVNLGDVTYVGAVWNKNVDLSVAPFTQAVTLLSAVLIVLCFFSVIYKWFSRFRG